MTHNPSAIKRSEFQEGRCVFNGVKTMSITFEKPFLSLPFVSLTLEDNNSAPPYKPSLTTTGLKIKFGSSFTGTVNWQAKGKI